MAMNRWVIHTASGEFKYGGFYDPTPPQTGTDAQGNPIYDPAFSVVTVAGEQMPDARVRKWNGSAVVAKTQAEIDSYDGVEKVKTRDKELGLKMIKALAIAVHKRIKRVVPTDATTAAEWESAIRAEWDALS